MFRLKPHAILGVIEFELTGYGKSPEALLGRTYFECDLFRNSTISLAHGGCMAVNGVHFRTFIRLKFKKCLYLSKLCKHHVS